MGQVGPGPGPEVKGALEHESKKKKKKKRKEKKRKRGKREETMNIGWNFYPPPKKKNRGGGQISNIFLTLAVTTTWYGCVRDPQFRPGPGPLER